jgi:hypothetical protein
MPKTSSNNNTRTTAPASLEAKIDAAADSLKACLPEIADKLREAAKASNHSRHAKMHRLHRAAHDFVLVVAEAH